MKKADIIAIILVIAGLYVMIWRSNNELGWTLLGIGGVTTIGHRGATAMKRRKKGPPTASIGMVAILLSFLFTSCQCPQDSVSMTQISDPLLRVTNRHDAYVINDASLSPEQKDAYLRTSKLIRNLIDEAQAKKNGDEQ